MSSQGDSKSAGTRLVMVLIFSSSSSRLAALEMKVVTAIVSLKEFVFITKCEVVQVQKSLSGKSHKTT